MRPAAFPSDGVAPPEQVIAEYQAAGYDTSATRDDAFTTLLRSGPRTDRTAPSKGITRGVRGARRAIV
jgi:hypothetical protein